MTHSLLATTEIVGGGGAEDDRAGEWRFRPNGSIVTASSFSIRGIITRIRANIDEDPGETRPTIPLGHGDPSVFPCFGTPPGAVDAVVAALRSGQYNCYPPCAGLAPARRVIADHLSNDLPYKLSPNDIYLTNGCSRAIEIVTSILAQPGANILLPRPGYLFYEAQAAYNGIEVRHFDLVSERDWEVDLDSLEAVADKNTVAMVIINPGNPCGNVYTYEHLSKVASTAKKLGILIIADEVYGHLIFGSKPFVPMGVFAHVVPVLSLGSISKRWVVPGWRLGWIVTNDPYGVLKKTKIVDCLKNYLDISTDPATFIQGAIPQIFENTEETFFKKTIDILKETGDICYNKLKDIDCITCPSKPESSMFVMVKLDLSRLKDICDDMDFCCKLAKEELVIILPGCAVGLKNWLRITFAVGPSSLEDGLERLKSFCLRHAYL